MQFEASGGGGTFDPVGLRQSKFSSALHGNQMITQEYMVYEKTEFHSEICGKMQSCPGETGWIVTVASWAANNNNLAG